MNVISFALVFLIETSWAATPISPSETSIQGETSLTDNNTIIIETDEAGRPAIELEAAQPKKQNGPARGQAPERSSSEVVSPKNAPQMGVQLKMPLSKRRKNAPTQQKE
jgi:hypothetical protein